MPSVIEKCTKSCRLHPVLAQRQATPDGLDRLLRGSLESSYHKKCQARRQKNKEKQQSYVASSRGPAIIYFDGVVVKYYNFYTVENIRQLSKFSRSHDAHAEAGDRTLNLSQQQSTPKKIKLRPTRTVRGRPE